MLRVDLYSWESFEQRFPDVNIWFTFTEGDKEVKINYDTETRLVTHIKEHGIVGRMGKTFTLKDGKKFLEELQFEFKGSRLRASEPYEV